MRVGVAELKARLSRYLEQVKGGGELVVTEHGRPVARIVPVAPAERLDARRQKLLRAGILLPGSGRLPKKLRTKPPGGRRESGVLAALIDERSSGR